MMPAFLLSRTTWIVAAVLIVGGIIGFQRVQLNIARAERDKAVAERVQLEQGLALAKAANDDLRAALKQQNEAVDALTAERDRLNIEATRRAAAQRKVTEQRRKALADQPVRSPAEATAWLKQQLQ